MFIQWALWSLSVNTKKVTVIVREKINSYVKETECCEHTLETSDVLKLS